MFAEITKTFESNQKLTKELVSQVSSASTAFAKTMFDVNTQLANAFKTQATEAYKNLESFKFPGFEAFAPKASKSSKE